MAVGMEPQSKRPTNTKREPKRSQSGPAMNLTKSLCVRVKSVIRSLGLVFWDGSLRGYESDDIRVRDLLLGHVQVTSDGDGQL